MIPHDPIREQSPYDKQVDLSNFNRLVRVVNLLAGMTFSKDFAVMSGSSGIAISLASSVTGWDTDYVVVRGNKLTVPENENGYSYLKIYRDGVTEPEWVEEMPGAQADDAEVVDMTSLHLHLPPLPPGGDENQVLAIVDDLPTWVDIPDQLPVGGSQYQVLQRDGDGNPVWDWVRWP